MVYIPIETDVLVIGGGLAGYRAALRARDLGAEVTLVDKAVIARSGATLWCHTIVAPVPQDNFTAWMREVVEFTEFFSDQECVEILLREGNQRLAELEEWGVPFERDEGGKYKMEASRGMMDNCRGIFFQGRFWMDRLKEQGMKRGIRVVNRVMITDLLTSDGMHPTQGYVVGAVGFHTTTGEFYTFKARAVVIASGTISSKLPASRTDNLTGDGQGMAFRAGAGLTGLEFDSGEGYFPIRNQQLAPLPSLIQFQCQGGFIVNRQGERIMEKYLPGRMERGSGRGPLGQALVKEVLEGRGPLYFDMRHWGEEKTRLMRATIPVTMARLDDAGIDIRKDRIEFTVITYGFSANGNGGIHVGINGETALPGLFATGAATKFRPSSETFGGAPQTNCNVFGYRTGEAAALAAANLGPPQIDPQQVQRLRETAFFPIEKKSRTTPDEIYLAINKKLLPWRYSIFKHEKRIKEALKEIERIEREDLSAVGAGDIHELMKANEVRNYLLMARIYHIASLERKESRCKHYREEYPYRDDVDWLKWLIFRRDGGKGLTMREEPIPIERYPIKLDKRERIPAPVQFSYKGIQIVALKLMEGSAG